MADRQFLRLNADWALAFDSRQWIIQRRNGAEGWFARKYIGTSVADLRRAIAALKIRVSRAAALELDRLPAAFGAFLEQQGVDRPVGDVRSKRYHCDRDRLREERAVSAFDKAPDSAITDKEAALDTRKREMRPYAPLARSRSRTVIIQT